MTQAKRRSDRPMWVTEMFFSLFRFAPSGGCNVTFPAFTEAGHQPQWT